jgi:hypothetical protein
MLFAIVHFSHEKLYIHHYYKEELMCTKGWFIAVSVISFSLLSAPRAADWKTVTHLATLPVIEGGGIYGSVKLYQATDRNVAKAAAITNISTLAATAGLGVFTLFFNPDDYQKWQKIHRIAAYLVAGSAVWLGIQAAQETDMSETDKAITYTYTGLTFAPLILFEF